MGIAIGALLYMIGGVIGWWPLEAWLLWLMTAVIILLLVIDIFIDMVETAIDQEDE